MISEQNTKCHSLQELICTKPVGGVIQDRLGVATVPRSLSRALLPLVTGFLSLEWAELAPHWSGS